MLLLAKAQGEDLLQLKEHTPHGEFQNAINQIGCLSIRQVQRYMKVAKRAVNDLFDVEASISAFLGEPTQAERAKAKRPQLTRADAEYALKINALATQGSTEGERDAAEGKLDNLAQQFGTSVRYRRRRPLFSTSVQKAEKLCPDQQLSSAAADERSAG